MEKEFISIINDNRALIFKVCNLYCGDRESRKDLFQEIVLQLWRSFPGFRGESAVSTWIYRVALNTAISNFRREVRKPDWKSLAIVDFDIPDMSGTPGEPGNSDTLYYAIQQLTEVERAVILLYLDEKTYEEIGAIVGISLSNVGVRINRIKNKLSKLIKTNDHEH